MKRAPRFSSAWWAIRHDTREALDASRWRTTVRTELRARNSGDPADRGRRPADHRGRLHDRYSGVRRRLGTAAAARPGHHSRAHTLDERVPKTAILDAVEIYQKMVRQLQSAMNKIEVGILGATGMVGQHFIKFLDGHPLFQLTWLGASERSAGKRYRDAAKWHLGGAAPDSDRDADGRRSEARQRAEASVLRHGCFRRDRNRTGIRAGRTRRRFEFEESPHGSRCAAARAGNQSGSPEADSAASRARADGRGRS